MIRFKTVRYKNFLSSGNQFTEVPLDKHKSTLIIGENGAGKSTILDAITFALFNKPYRDINKGLLINSVTNKKMLVELEFETNGKNYLIRRGSKPNVFDIEENGVILNHDAANVDYQEMLEQQIIRRNYKTFCQVDVIGSASYVPFMNLSTPQRRAVIEDLLDLMIFSSMNIIQKDKVKLNAELIRDVETKLNMATYSLETARKAIEASNKSHDTEIANLKESLEEASNRRRELGKKIEVLEKEYDLFVFSHDIDVIRKELQEFNNMKKKLSFNYDLAKKQIDFFTQHNNCITCSQSIDPEFKQQIIDQNTKRIEEYNGYEKTLNRKIENREEKLKVVSAEYDVYNKLKNNINNLTTEIRIIETQIQSYKSNIEKYTNKKDEVIPEFDIKKIQSEIDSFDNEISVLKEDRQVLVMAGSMLKDNATKADIIKQYIPMINQIINKYLTKMNLIISYELSETFEETIKSRYRNEFKYASFSEGEKFRINIAILLAFRDISRMRNSVSSNILIMDEIFNSSLDEAGVSDFIKLIQSFHSETNCIVISHNTDNIRDVFDNVIQFKKIGGFSHMEGV